MTQKGRRWCFTVNNPDADEENSATLYELKQNERVLYMVVELEHEEDGTPHWQGYLEYSNSTTRQNISSLLHNKGHVELAKGDRIQNTKYCSKEFRANQTEWIDFKGTDLETIKNLRDEDVNAPRAKRKNYRRPVIDKALFEKLQFDSWDNIAKEMPEMVFYNRKNIEQIKNMAKRKVPEQTPSLKMKNYWLKGPKGIGKTSWLMTKCEELHVEVYHKNLDKWWNDFIPGEHEVVLIDDFDPNTDLTIKAMLKRWADRYPLHEEVKGGYIQFHCMDFCLCVTSNYSIEECYYGTDDAAPIKRRFLEIDCSQFANSYGHSMDRVPFFPYFFLKRGLDPAVIGGCDISDPIWKEDVENIHYTKKHDFVSDTSAGNWINKEPLQIACRIDGAGEMIGYKQESRVDFIDEDSVLPIYEKFDVDTNMVIASRRRKIYGRDVHPGQGTIPPVRMRTFEDETRPDSQVEAIVEKQISTQEDDEDSIVE